MNKLIIDQHELTGLVNKICRNILVSGWRPDYIVGITRGGLIPAVMISQYLNIPMHTLGVSLRDGSGGESNLWMAEEAFGYVPKEDRGESDTETDPAFRKNILIVDDINDTGATIAWIKKDWRSGCLPKHYVWDQIFGSNVRFAVITNNLSSKEEVDYSVNEINKAEEDVWIVYPWER